MARATPHHVGRPLHSARVPPSPLALPQVRPGARPAVPGGADRHGGSHRRHVVQGHVVRWAGARAGHPHRPLCLGQGAPPSARCVCARLALTERATTSVKQLGSAAGRIRRQPRPEQAPLPSTSPCAPPTPQCQDASPSSPCAAPRCPHLRYNADRGIRDAHHGKQHRDVRRPGRRAGPGLCGRPVRPRCAGACGLLLLLWDSRAPAAS